MNKNLSNLVNVLKSFFTGIRYQSRIISNPFNENGLPFLLETKYFMDGEISYKSGFNEASSKDLKKYYFQE
jgi:hypothetical protein